MTPDPHEENAACEADNENPVPDPRVAAILNELGLSYEILPESGTFKTGYLFEDGRSQEVFIRSMTEEFLGVELREITSPALVSRGIFDARTANFLLRENSTMKFGAWCIEVGEDNGHFAVFNVKVGAALPARPFSDILEMVAKVADGTEARLSGLDEF
jgi:hypothetical protein